MHEKGPTKKLFIQKPEVKPEAILKQLHSFEGKLAELISNFAGNMFFVYFHVIWFTLWILINQGFFKPILHPYDPFPYGLLTMIVSLEAIFLSTFILINQNRQALLGEYRELEEEKEEQEAEEEVEDIQKDLEDIKSAIAFIQQKISKVETAKANQDGTGNDKDSSKNSAQKSVAK